MKILLDSCVWGGALNDLRAKGYDVVWAGSLSIKALANKQWRATRFFFGMVKI